MAWQRLGRSRTIPTGVIARPTFLTNKSSAASIRKLQRNAGNLISLCLAWTRLGSREDPIQGLRYYLLDRYRFSICDELKLPHRLLIERVSWKWELKLITSSRCLSSIRGNWLCLASFLRILTKAVKEKFYRNCFLTHPGLTAGNASSVRRLLPSKLSFWFWRSSVCRLCVPQSSFACLIFAYLNFVFGFVISGIQP